MHVRGEEVSATNRPIVKALDAEYFIVPPPSSLTVEATPRVVLYKADGTALKRSIGYSASSKAIAENR